MDLVDGKKYYIMSDECHSSEIDTEHFNSFKKSIFKGVRFSSSGHPTNVYAFYVFEIVNEDKTITQIDFMDSQVDQKVFKDRNEILVYLHMHIENLGPPYRFSESMKKKIIKSQEDYPELWV